MEKYNNVDDSKKSSQKFSLELFDLFWSVKTVEFLFNRTVDFCLILTEILCQQKRPEILKVNPKAKVTEVVKEIARCWSLMTKDDRMTYKLEAKRGKFTFLSFEFIEL
jgi:hypothetical protein